MTPHAIPPSWFARPPEDVAPTLLGCFVVRWAGGNTMPLRGMIVETEAYSGLDPACHGFCGVTARNRVLFGPPGRAYIYKSYGIHHCLNTVTGSEGEASGVLIRALWFDSTGTPQLPPTKPHRWAAGPGKVCRSLHLDLGFNGAPLEPSSGLWLEPRSGVPLPWGIVQTTRIGITKGRDTPWRWLLQGCPAVSKPIPRVGSQVGERQNLF